MPRGSLLVAAEFLITSQVKEAILEFRCEAVFCFHRESVTGINGDDPGGPRDADNLSERFGGEFRWAEMHHFETEIKEKTFEANRQRRAAFEQKNTRKMAMAGVALLNCN